MHRHIIRRAKLTARRSQALSVTGMEHMVTLSARLCAVECGHGRREIPIWTTLLDAVAMIKWRVDTQKIDLEPHPFEYAIV